MKRRVYTGLGVSFLAVLLLALLATDGASSGVVAGPARGTTWGSSPATQNTVPAAVEVAWDDADSHKWIGEAWGDDAPSSLTWGNFHGRDCLEVRWDYPAWLGYARSDLFPDENWEWPVIGLQADLYVESSQSWTDIGIEPRDHSSATIELLWGDATNIVPDQWHTVTWLFTEAEDYQAVAGLVFKIDQLGNDLARVYLDDLRLVTDGGSSEQWDDMADDSRWWFYFGNWYDWSVGDLGLEPISHNGGNPSTPAGSVYLQWDQPNGVDPAGTTAEVGTGELDDNPDWSGYNRLSADVKVSAADVPLSIFLWDEEGSGCQGFGTPTRKAGVADSWQTITWDLPWPPCFDNTGIDEVKFVVKDIDTYQTGTLFLDNISLISDTPPPPATGLAYVFEDFNDMNPLFNDFSGNWGVLISDSVTTVFDTTVFTGTWGASLKVDYNLPEDSYTGLWHSLWGHSDYTQTHYLDFTDIYGDLSGEAKDFEQLQFWVRGSGATSGTHNLKVELKDTSGEYDRTAYRYITIDDSDTAWRQIVLDADVTNASFWSYNLEPPDPTRMKQIVFIIESYFNNPTGTFYIDDIQFVDADDTPFDPGQRSEDEFLNFVSEKTFLYFLDWYDPNTGLFQDRSTFPDLMSTAATGFGLTALTIGESRGWIERPLAIEMITRALHTLDEGQSAADTVTDAISSTNGYKGFYYHFLGSDGLRKFDGEKVGSELSSVDTAILMMGILSAKEYFSDVPEIRDLADELYRKVEWEWMLDPGNDLFHMAWKPEDSDPDYQNCTPGGGCFSNAQWGYYTDEAILINLLAIGSPAHPVSPDVFYAWSRELGAYGGHTLIQSWNGSFFTYVFAHLWIDFAVLGEDNHPSLPVDWWENSVEAAWANWQFVMDHRDEAPGDEDKDYTTYGENSWGLTAAEGPYPSDYEDDEGNTGAYRGYGALPAHEIPIHDGTIAPYGAGMATSLLPEKAIPALMHYFANTDLWRYRFGFGDAYTLDPPDVDDPPWYLYDHVSFGIDQGPLLIAIENYRSGLVWDTLAGNPDLFRAICSIWYCHKIYLPLVLK